LLGDRVFVGTWDSKLLALSAATGKVLWEATVGEYPGTYISGAPLVFHDLVVTGVGSPPGYGRNFIVAFDVRAAQGGGSGCWSCWGRGGLVSPQLALKSAVPAGLS